MLYTMNASPTSSRSLESLLRIAAKGDPILLLEDGVHAARAGAATERLALDALAAHPVYALGPDLKARAIEKVVEGIRIVGYDGFVELVEQHTVVPWV
jgi:tRNA 2-thiouridine synthesizing protein B